MTEFDMNAAIVDDANPAKYADDARNAFFQLENNDMGGGGVNTAAFYATAFLPEYGTPHEVQHTQKPTISCYNAQESQSLDSLRSHPTLGAHSR